MLVRGADLSEVHGCEVVGNEKHVLEQCPQFSSERQLLFNKVKRVVRQYYGLGTSKMPHDTVDTYRQRKKRMEEEGAALNLQFQQRDFDITWNHLWTGCIGDIPLPDDAYAHIAVILGAYVPAVNQTKSSAYEKRSEVLTGEHVHGEVCDFDE